MDKNINGDNMLNELKEIKQELKKLNHFLSNTNLYKQIKQRIKIGI